MYKIPPGGGGGSIASSRPNMSIYFDIIGIRKYVIKKVIYNIGNTIMWAFYQQ